MAAHNSNNEQKNYYNISYGKLSNRVKVIPDNLKEITEAELKQKTQAVENIDLRNTYIIKDGERPYVVFYDYLKGTIQGIVKNVGDQYTSLQIDVLDVDGELSVIQSKFYSKYTENLLNRLINANLKEEMLFNPYSIPNEFELGGRKIKAYTQGVSIRQESGKVEPRYDSKSTELPKLESVRVNGKETTSRDTRIDFLYENLMKIFSPPAPKATEPAKQSGGPLADVPLVATFEEGDDLPF